MSDDPHQVSGPSLTPPFGDCPFCRKLRGYRAQLGEGREVLAYRLQCWTCGDQGPIPDFGPLRRALEDSLLDGQVRAARYRTPLAGDRRAKSLEPAAWEADAAEHRRADAAPHLLERFNGEDWELVGVASDGDTTRSWLGGENADIKRPHRSG